MAKTLRVGFKSGSAETKSGHHFSLELSLLPRRTFAALCLFLSLSKYTSWLSSFYCNFLFSKLKSSKRKKKGQREREGDERERRKKESVRSSKVLSVSSGRKEFTHFSLSHSLSF
jgi:hypothetical protein